MKMTRHQASTLLSLPLLCAWSAGAILSPSIRGEASHPAVDKDAATHLQAVSRARATTLHEVIASPVAEHFAELQGRQIDAQSMRNATTSTPGGGTVTIKAFDANVDKYVSGDLHAGRGWDTSDIDMVFSLWRLNGKKGNFLDIGANIGSWSLPLAAAFHSAGKKVIAIEAMPPIADHFRAGIVANRADNVVFFPYAVGAPVPQNDVQMALNPTNKGGSAVVGNMGWTYGAQTFSVGLSTLDAMLRVEPEMANVLFAKMDIEGNEGRAIAGAQQLFRHAPPCALFIELNPTFLAAAGTSVAAIQAQLAGFGYDIPGGVQMNAENFQYRQKDWKGCMSRLH